MSDAVLERIREIIHRDVNNRGLAKSAVDNLFTRCKHDFSEACLSLSGTKEPVVAIVTGFYIPKAKAAETDGPLGSVFLARALCGLGAKVVLATETFCDHALSVAVHACGLAHRIRIVSVRKLANPEVDPYRGQILFCVPPLTHLIAVERPGPSHEPESVARLQTDSGALQRFCSEVPQADWNQYHNMKGRTIGANMYPAHILFEHAPKEKQRITTIGIGDGGNEIGMGKIPWEVIANNIPNGHLIACRVPTDYNVVCGVSNWAAYGLAAGVWYLRGMKFDEELFSPERERRLWEKVLEEAVLVDGVTGRRTLTVDGLAWDDYIQPLREIGDVLRASCPP